MNFMSIGCDKMNKIESNHYSYYNDFLFPNRNKVTLYSYFNARKAIIDRKNIENDNRLNDYFSFVDIPLINKDLCFICKRDILKEAIKCDV